MALDTLQESEIRGLDALETGQGHRRSAPRSLWAWLWPKVAAVAIALAGVAGRSCSRGGSRRTCCPGPDRCSPSWRPGGARASLAGRRRHPDPRGRRLPHRHRRRSSPRRRRVALEDPASGDRGIQPCVIPCRHVRRTALIRAEFEVRTIRRLTISGCNCLSHTSRSPAAFRVTPLAAASSRACGRGTRRARRAAGRSTPRTRRPSSTTSRSGLRLKPV